MVRLFKKGSFQPLVACIFFTSFAWILPVFSDDVDSSNLITQENKLEFITSVGRAAIDSPEETSLARRRALEDALYLASLRGGAKVNGYSSVGTGTELTDNFVVRPTTKILDYAILKEVIKETHYEVTVKVAGSCVPSIIGVCDSKSNSSTKSPGLTTSHKVRSPGSVAEAWLVTIKLKTGLTLTL